MPVTSADPGIHNQAGLVNVIRASRQATPRMVQSTVPAAPCTRRSRPIAVTATVAAATAAAACAMPRPPARARGTSHAATASMPSHTTTGTAGWR